jgi:hypothetical protein
MHNTVLKNDLKSLTKQKDDLEITNGEVGGCSIEIFNPISILMLRNVIVILTT